MTFFEKLEEELEQHEDFSFFENGKYDNLGNCFDFTYETIPAGESRKTDGRIGILVRGEGSYDFRGEKKHASRFDVFGLEYNQWGNSEPAPTVFTAETDGRVIWADYNVCTSVCYASCWYHGQLIREIKEAYGRQHDMKVMSI